MEPPLYDNPHRREADDEIAGTDRAFSGQLRVRLPVSLHGELVRAAADERVSLNQFISAALAGAVRWRSSPEALREAEHDRAERRRRRQAKLVEDMWRDILRD